MSIEQQISDMLWEGNPICPEYKAPAEKFFDAFALASAEGEGMIAPPDITLSVGVDHYVIKSIPSESVSIPVMAQ